MPVLLSAQFGRRTLLPIVAGLAVVIAVLACRSANPTAAPSAHTATHDIVVHGAQWAKGVTAALRDTLVVPPPGRYDEWRVRVVNPQIVRLITSGDRVRRPGSAGWRLEAVGRGETTVEFVPFVPLGDKSSAPNEPHFTLRVTVR